MSVESISRGFGSYTTKYAEPTVDEGHQSILDNKVSDPDGSLHQPASKLRDSVLETVPNGLDVSDNGVDSQADATGNTSKSKKAGPFPDTGVKIKNVILDQVLTGLDLNGDGIISQTEGIKNAVKYNIAAKLFEEQDETAGHDALRTLA